MRTRSPRVLRFRYSSPIERPGLARAELRRWYPQRFEVDPEKSEEWNRGAYLSRGLLAHCGECHTLSRTFMGATDDDLYYVRNRWRVPIGELAPNITPHEG